MKITRKMTPSEKIYYTYWKIQKYPFDQIPEINKFGIDFLVVYIRL